MSTATKTLKASCLCGAAKHDITLPISEFPLKAFTCHCDSCRHALGTMYASIVILSDDYQPDKALLKNCTPFAFSPRLTYYHCTTCGTQMMAHSVFDGKGPFWMPTTGTLDMLEGNVEWVAHEHIQDTLDGGLSDLLSSVNGKRMERWPGTYKEGEQLPANWTSILRPKVTTTPDDKLRCYCKCGGVDFWVSRPTNQSAVVEKYWPDNPPETVPNEDLPPEEETFWYLRDHRKKYLAGFCACDSCRLACGIEVTAWAFVPTINITLDREGRIPWSTNFGTLKQYRSSVRAYRYFCATCGAIVFYETEDRWYVKDVAMGLFDAAEGAKVDAWFVWRTHELWDREDAAQRAESLVLAVEEGLKKWGIQKGQTTLSGGSDS